MRRLSIDVGGTFTDCLVLQTDGRIDSFKSPTKPDDPTAGVLRCLDLAATSYGESTEDFLAKVSAIVHGTTLALNSLITGTGPRVGMITTEGFRDIIEIRRGLRDQRVSLYNLFIPPYEPLVPRHLRLGVEERVLYDGSVERPLDEDGTRIAAQTLRDQGVESVAICFLHSYANQSHEERAAAICAEVFGSRNVTTSHAVLPAWREFERFSTTVVSAYLAPTVLRYVSDLQSALERRGLVGPLLMMLANGLVETVDEVAERAINLLNSGPSAAPFGGLAAAGASVGASQISVDMGGTSFDVCVSSDGVVPTTTDTWVEDHRVAIKMVDVRSIGAGGGSIASVDELGLLRVGPESAGADPGPACYGKGGTRPTVTDANLVLGYVPPTTLAAGTLRIDREAGHAALGRLGAELDMSPEEAAIGVYETVTATMADNIMETCTREGHDVRDFALVVGGGAGPLHGASLARRLEIPRVFIPAAAGLYSAFGMLTMATGRDFVRSYPTRAYAADPGTVARLFAEMEGEALAAFERMGVSTEDVRLERTGEMRYERQFHELEVPLAAGPISAATLQSAAEGFHDHHAQRFGFEVREMPVELLSFHLRATAPAPEVTLRTDEASGGGNEAAPVATRSCHWGTEGAIETPVFRTRALPPSTALEGPAIVEDKDTTIVLPPDFRCTVDVSGGFVLESLVPAQITTAD